LSRCDNPAACSGGTARTNRSVCGKPLRRWTRRYSSQRDEFHHAKQIPPIGGEEKPAAPKPEAASSAQAG